MKSGEEVQRDWLALERREGREVISGRLRASGLN